MLCTFIHETYSLTDARQLSEALVDLFSPLNEDGWASSGVYCFYDIETHEVLYIGLALDLAQRFNQHNGLVSVDPNSCKYSEISQWFTSHKKIGYSVLVQSALSQPSFRKFNMRYGLSAEEMEMQYGYLVKEGYEAIVNTEGLLIEAHKLNKGKMPRWNNIGGSLMGREAATATHFCLLQLFTGEVDDWMVARKSITEISRNPLYQAFEHYLHGIRGLATGSCFEFKETWNFFPHDELMKSQLIKSDYLPEEWLLEL